MATFQLHQTLLPYSIKVLCQDESNEPKLDGIKVLCQEESNEPKLDGVASFNYGVPMPPSSSIIRRWLPYSIKVLVKTNQTSPNSMGLRRLITEFLWPPSQLHHQTLITI
ncbi:hypothetical protein EVAR_91951_1 [Eumeta japonica]|uniref:Uncharacterized protein n=1 Tax=Eumeta variegata TaxID=151549 RepID=A0A4C1SXP3_EUMVA|nr:hypothetical protein EVAR_91951_1 [Eumeta japonica]